MAIGLPLLRLRRSRCRAPVIALVHHLRSSEPGPPRVRRLAGLVERVALSCVDAVVCTSFTTAVSVRPLLSPTAPIHVVKPGCDLHAPGMKREPRSRKSDTNTSLRVLMVAHWTPRKGVLDVLRALELTSREITLDLVGDPDRDPSYARRVRGALRRPVLAGRVRVHGRAPSERLAALYELADALVSASTHEGYGMVLAEAVAAGLPIVATRVGAVPEVVREGREAELVAPGDPGALARALERLLSDPAERCRRAGLARERAASLPRWQESCARFADVLETVIGERRS
jgi:glycosyltransferase involved in cell wall biosynthesis